jgi:ATP-dependent Zn protease
MLAKRPNHQVTKEMLVRLAQRCAGLSLANLESVIELAARNSAKQAVLLNDELLEEAFELSQHGEEKNWGHEYLERVARHEAGHAYLCFLSGKTPSYLTIVARGKHGGYMEHADTQSSPLQTKEALLGRIRIALGGRAAEVVYYGDEDGISTGASGDLESATNIARAMLVTYGMDSEFGLAALSCDEAAKGPQSAEIIRKINTILNKQMALAINAIRNGKPKLDALVDALLEKNKLTAEEMEMILRD